jgi:hypothetical protein
MSLHAILSEHPNYTSFKSARLCARGDPLFRRIAKRVTRVKQAAKRSSRPGSRPLTDEEAYPIVRADLLSEPDVIAPTFPTVPTTAVSAVTAVSVPPPAVAPSYDLLLDVFAHTSALLRVVHAPPPDTNVSASLRDVQQRRAELEKILNHCRATRRQELGRGTDVLAPGQWLNDNVLAFGADSLNLLHGFPAVGEPSTHAFCFTPLNVSSDQPVMLSQIFRRYPSGTRANDLPHRWLLLPLHLGQHWALAVYDRRKPMLILLDSMKDHREPASLEGMTTNLRLLPQRLGHTIDTLRIMRQPVTQQRDGSSCGLFVLELMRHICSTPSFDYTPFSCIEVDVTGVREKLIEQMSG